MAFGIKSLRAVLLASALGAAATSADAATIVLHNIGGVTPGSDAYNGFRRAANFWGSQFSNDATINLDVGFNHLGPDILGSTRSTFAVKSIQSVEGHLIAGASTSAIDQAAAANLPALSPTSFGVGGVDVITPGYTHPETGAGNGNPFGTGNPYGIDNSTNVYDTDGTFNNVAIGVTTANAKALGYAVDPHTVDGSITFSSDFAFDFNPTDGITPGTIDFLSVATHEIGHALGFVSGVDDYDTLGGPNSPYATYDCGGFQCQDYPAEDDWFGETLDLFRYSNDPHNVAPGNGPTLTWAPGVESYFSVDGGATNLGGFSTGTFNGDTWQASHWKAPTSAPFCSGLLGIMNPYACNGTGGIVTNRDRQAFDAIGWNLNDQGDRQFTTADIYRNIGVPEPAAWTLLIGGFGLSGAMLRRRRAATLSA
jgi:hypothetical protein